MKIGILTLQLKTNYGCLLQAYALQRFLKLNGFDPLTIRHFNDLPLKFKLLSMAKRSLLRCLGKSNLPIRGWMFEEEYKVVSRNTENFINKHIKTTEVIDLSKDKSIISKYKFDALVVGSDQCWRPKSGKRIQSFFLANYTKENIRRISYAASLGVENWEYTEEEAAQCKSLIQLFDGVSVREDSAVKICKERFNIDANHVVDPTLLLTKSDYLDLIDNPKSIKKSVMVYVLDESSDKRLIVEKVKAELGLEENRVMPNADFANVGKANIQDCIFPPLEDWLNGFKECDFVVTDSFHGTVFALIFNKPFISIGNKTRGMTRFTSLLKLFNLERRLINSFDDLSSNLIFEDIDFESVNKIKADQADIARDYLTNCLLNK